MTLWLLQQSWGVAGWRGSQSAGCDRSQVTVLLRSALAPVPSRAVPGTREHVSQSPRCLGMGWVRRVKRMEGLENQLPEERPSRHLLATEKQRALQTDAKGDKTAVTKALSPARDTVHFLLLLTFVSFVLQSLSLAPHSLTSISALCDTLRSIIHSAQDCALSNARLLS